MDNSTWIIPEWTTMPPEKFAHNEELRNAALATDQMERALALVRQIAVMQTSMEGYVENYRWDTVIHAARKVVDAR